MKFNEFDVVEIAVDFPEYRITAGTMATIIDVYDNGDFEVEVANEEGDTIAFFSVKPEQVRPARKHETLAA